ncbi:MAG: hypothetical protein U1D97_09620 [Desulfuromonadales bacterium]|nr:hypothetical protein [Desulfuromonadales bacterium]
MINKIVICLFFILLTTVFQSYASESSDFIKYTDSTLDALDEVEVVITSKNGTERDADKALQKVDIALKKFDRIQMKEDSPENDLFLKITYCRLRYAIVLNEGIYGEQHDKARSEYKEIMDLFGKYKTKNKKKQKNQ